MMQGLPDEAPDVPNVPLWGKGAFSWDAQEYEGKLKCIAK